MRHSVALRRTVVAMSTAVFVLGATGADRITRLRPSVGAVVLPDGGVASWFNLAPTTYTPPRDAD